MSSNLVEYFSSSAVAKAATKNTKTKVIKHFMFVVLMKYYRILDGSKVIYMKFSGNYYYYFRPGESKLTQNDCERLPSLISKFHFDVVLMMNY